MADTSPEGASSTQRGLLSPLLVAIFSIGVFAAGTLVAGRFPAAHVAAASQDPPVKSVELTHMIEQVKAGLFEAELAARRNHQLTLFKLDGLDLEINVVARAEDKGSIKLWTVGNEFSTGSEKVQKVHLHWIAAPEQRAGIAQASSLDPSDLNETTEELHAHRK